MTIRHGALLAGFCVVALAGPVSAQSAPATAAEGAGTDAYTLRAQSTTYVRMFQRALRPGPAGASVTTDTLAPAYEYLHLRATNLDTSWEPDSTDLELSLWGRHAFAAPAGERSFAGDVTVANVTHRWGPAQFRLGRQMIATGSLGLRQLDGASAGFRSGGFGFSGYGGLSVLPRWDDRPGYHHLGSAADSLVRNPDALPEASRTEHWMLGARADYFRASSMRAGLALHEERQFNALGRRDLTADMHWMPLDFADLTLEGMLDLDSLRPVQALAAVDVRPIEELDVSVEYRRLEPALLLPRQSVLAVFMSDGFHEVGGELGYQVVPEVRLTSGAYADFFGAGDTGMRAELGVRASLLPRDQLVLLAKYGRVSEPENGYHSERIALRYRIADPFAITAEHYGYFYDTAIAAVSTSTVEAATAEWQPIAQLRVMLGGSVARTPYATLDAQTLLRVAYADDFGSGGRP